MLSQRRIAACLNLSISESKLKFVYTAPAGWFRARREEDVGGGLFAGGWDQVSKHSLWNPIAAGALKWRRWDLRREATSAFTADARDGMMGGRRAAVTQVVWGGVQAAVQTLVCVCWAGLTVWQCSHCLCIPGHCESLSVARLFTLVYFGRIPHDCERHLCKLWNLGNDNLCQLLRLPDTAFKSVNTWGGGGGLHYETEQWPKSDIFLLNLRSL